MCSVPLSHRGMWPSIPICAVWRLLKMSFNQSLLIIWLFYCSFSSLQFKPLPEMPLVFPILIQVWKEIECFGLESRFAGESLAFAAATLYKHASGRHWSVGGRDANRSDFCVFQQRRKMWIVWIWNCSVFVFSAISTWLVVSVRYPNPKWVDEWTICNADCLSSRKATANTGSSVIFNRCVSLSRVFCMSSVIWSAVPRRSQHRFANKLRIKHSPYPEQTHPMNEGANLHHDTSHSIAYFLLPLLLLLFLLYYIQISLPSFSLADLNLICEEITPHPTELSLKRPFSLAYFKAELPVSKQGRISCSISKPSVDSSRRENAIADGLDVSGTAVTHP